MPRKGKGRPGRPPQPIVPRPSEQLLLDHASELVAPRILCTTLGRAQLAAALARAQPQSPVTCHFLDLYRSRQAAAFQDPLPTNLDCCCEADLPAGPFDLVAFPFQSGGEAELTRELMQQGYDRLVEGGRLYAAIENARDTWLHAEMKKLFPKVTVHRSREGIVYAASRTGPLKKERDFSCEFAFRDGERLIHAISRPGVFSHRRLDLGARSLLNGLKVNPGERVLDLGCGAGVLSLAAAQRASDVNVLALDSNPRAVQCTQLGAARNGLENVTALLSADGNGPDEGTFDVCLANPPYYSNYRIADVFLQAAWRALRPGGRLVLVAKSSDWYAEHVPLLFGKFEVTPVGPYVIVGGTRRREPRS